MGTKVIVNSFQQLTISCPLCEIEDTHHRIKPTLYRETSRDIDLRPKSVDWNPKASPKVDPKVYFFWKCNHCHFCSDQKSYITPFAEGIMSAVRFRKLLKPALEQDAAYMELKELLAPQDEDKTPQFVKAMRRCFLAIYQHEAVEEIAIKESLKIGSYYLRLAWMIRDIKTSKTKANLYKLPTRELLRQTKRIWPSLPITELSIVQRAIEYYTRSLKQSHAIKTTLSEIQINLVIARMYLQIGELKSAHHLLLENRTRAKNYELIVKQKEKSAKQGDSEIDQMSMDASKAVNSVRNVYLIYEHLDQIRFKKEVDQALKFFIQEELGKKEITEQRDSLKKKGYEEEIIDKIAPIQKKKGIFEFLK